MESRAPFIPPWLGELVAPFRKHAVLAVALGFAALCCATLLMFVSGYLICRTAQPQTTLFMVMVPVALVQLFGLGRPLARYFERLVSHDWVFRVTSALRAKLFDSVSMESDDPSRTRLTGEHLELLVDDIGHLQNLYLRVAFPLVSAIAIWLIACVFAGLFSVVLACVLLVLGTLSVLLVPLAAYLLARPLQAQAKSLKSCLYAQVADNMLGAVDWALAGRCDEAARACERAGTRASDAEASVRRLARAAEFASAALIALGVCAVAIASGGAFQADGATVNYIAAFALGLFPLAETVAALPDAATNSIAHKEAVSRLDDVVSSAALKRDEDRDIRHLLGDEGRIVFDGATYRYPQSSRLALDGIDLDIPPGQKIAVLGRSGSGKTTLAALLRGALRPCAGTVAVGGFVASVPQSPHLFDQTLRENLGLAAPDATDAELEGALRMTGLSGKLAALEQGLDTPIGETGAGFSGGEAHRVSLSRALLMKSPIVVLDEPFSALDPQTERQLLDTLFTAFAGKTLVVITHHLAEIERFDRAVFIEEGRVTLDGAPRDLMRESPSFKQLLAFDRGTLA